MALDPAEAERVLARLGEAKYLLLTTYRKDGSPVPTPVWVARDGDALVVWTVTTTAKVRRLRNDPRVELAECTFKGAPLGPGVAGTGRVLDDPERTERARSLIKKKYGLTGWLTVQASVIRRGRSGTIGLELTPTG
ncbi:PPOX class F420-dependent oxidoreductase [Yinghuangia seranimata]|uniref:PPOX class F420-dependent oxidoreductase n=1 Tax=Yinghuangia seranimata TaxID=408067 RepID=UPI00248BF918|nr:PPOX class F420-dependent oxidoreductase [Yinghuangia seranimata]MDI2127222.1 PPOX class F420-dependent oxidoreductase [Yinghuangia seranimata]